MLSSSDSSKVLKAGGVGADELQHHAPAAQQQQQQQPEKMDKIEPANRGETSENDDGEETNDEEINNDNALAPTATSASDYPGIKMGAFKRRALMSSICLALFLAALDMTIVATALPTITSSLSATAAQYAWVGSSYTLASTTASPIWAKTSDVFGRKVVILAANAMFMVGSLVAALAGDIGVLIAGRTVQGLGGGGLLILVTIIISDLFHIRDRAKYYGLTGLVFALASSVGPVLGGVFTSTIGWRWCFWINLPFDGASLVVLFFVLDTDWPQVSFAQGLRELDWMGSLLIVGGTITFLYGLETGAGGTQPWGSPQVVCLLVFGVLIMAAFFAYEASPWPRRPLFPMRVFTSLSITAAFLTTCLHSFVFISYDYFLPLYFQVVLGFTPIISGVSLFALVVPLSVVTFLTGMLVRRTGNYVLPIWAGTALMTLGSGLYIAFEPTANWAKIIVFQIIAGIGAGPLFQAPMIAMQSQVPKKDVASATSAMSFMRTLFTSTSIVIGSVLLQHSLGGASLTGPHDEQSSKQSPEEQKNTYMYALRIMWGFYTAVNGLLLVVTFFIRPNDLRKNTPMLNKAPDSESEKGQAKQVVVEKEQK